MLELEKRGIPTVAWVVPGFVGDAKMSGKAFGFKDIALAVLPEDTYFQTSENIRQLVANSIDQVVEALTKPVTEVKAEVARPSELLLIQGENLLDATEKMNRRFLSEGWSDGFPLVAPTPQAVERMLTGTRLSRDQVIAVIEPGFGIATVEKIATNAVMAGCRPEHMSLLITAVRCIAEPDFELRSPVMSTGAQAPLMLINGPIAKKLNINSKNAALDPGSCSYANIVIGRALSLIIMNIGHGYPGVMSMSTIGNPMNYSCCVAENEEDNPWEPYHVEKGYDKDTSTVTIMFVRGMTTFGDLTSNTAESFCKGLSWIASRVNNMPMGQWLYSRDDWRPETKGVGQNLFLLCPANVRLLAKEGWGKKAIQQYLFDHAWVPFEVLMYGKEPKIVMEDYPELIPLLKHNPELPLPIVSRPDCFNIAVVGGSGQCSSYFDGSTHIVTLPIEE